MTSKRKRKIYIYIFPNIVRSEKYVYTGTKQNQSDMKKQKTNTHDIKYIKREGKKATRKANKYTTQETKQIHKQTVKWNHNTQTHSHTHTHTATLSNEYNIIFFTSNLYKFGYKHLCCYIYHLCLSSSVESSKRSVCTLAKYQCFISTTNKHNTDTTANKQAKRKTQIHDSIIDLRFIISSIYNELNRFHSIIKNKIDKHWYNQNYNSHNFICYF